RRMGVSSLRYGHVFLYKNGFRIYPYGEPGEDPLKIDSRKTQGYSRYLGTRDILGQISIEKDNDQLKETSSRGDGFIKTPTYLQLEDFFYQSLKRLEKYVVGVQQWGLNIEDDESEDLNVRILDFIQNISESNEIIDFEYSENLFDIITKSKDKSVEGTIESLRKISATSEDKNLVKQVNKAINKLSQVSTVNMELASERRELKSKIETFAEELDLKEKEVELLREATNEDVVELMVIEHHINQATFRVDDHIIDLYQIAKENPKIKDSIIDLINKISLENKKIASLVKFIRKANIDLLSSTVKEDLMIYIKQYVKNVYKKDLIRTINKLLINNVTVNYKEKTNFVIDFVPLEINIILDNLLDNSFKANAQNVNIFLSINNDELTINYQDDGIGVTEKNSKSIFDFGFSTTKGSGIGLYHIKNILTENYNGSIELNKSKYGANFIIKIKGRNEKI
ncbi:MAG: ATP-binding protein, partial [Flavobacteriaceae bacterium]